MAKKSKKSQAALQQKQEQQQRRQSDAEVGLGPTPGTLEGRVTLVTSLHGYDGTSTEEKIDNMITRHDVVMINRSWCLFSIDATDFLVQMGANVHSFEVDNHDNGSRILKYLAKKYNHRT